MAKKKELEMLDGKYVIEAVSAKTLETAVKKLEASLGVEIPAPYVVRIKKGSTEVKKSAFYGCKFISDVIFPEGIKSIGSYAFQGCTGLTEIVLPEGVTPSINTVLFDFFTISITS